MLVADSVTRHMEKFHPDLDVKKADERPRKRFRCPMEDCKSVTSRLKQHLENSNDLKGSDRIPLLLRQAKPWMEEMRVSERLGLLAYQNAISGTTYEGRDIGGTTAKSYVAQVKSFIPSFSRQGLDSLLCIGDKGALIEVNLRELSAGTVRAYLYTLHGFLKWFKVQPEWLQEVDLSSDRMATIIAKVGQNANAMGKMVNKERVAKEADAPSLDPKQLKLAMVGSYLSAKDRHDRFRDLLERKTVNNETLTREEFTNVRDNLMLLLTIRNIKPTTCLI